MRVLLLIILCCTFINVKAQYRIEMDSTTCRLEITRNNETKEMFLIDRVMYVDKESNQIQIFDGITTWRGRASEVTNFASIAAIKTDIDTYIDACR